MPKPYSNDLRLKVINLIKQGKKQTEISKLLQIDKSTIYRWYKEFKYTGSVKPKSYNQNQDRIKINLSKVEEIITKEPSLTLWQIARRVGNVTNVTVFNAIKKLGFSFKKSHGYIKNEMKKQEDCL
jgi:transposase